MKLLDGKLISELIYNELKTDLSKLKIKPGLSVILVGSRKDSLAYVNMKIKKCRELGINSNIIKYSEHDVSDDILCNKIQELNMNSNINGILIQLPLPRHINTGKVLSMVSLDKDVDGFHFENMGRLAVDYKPVFTPCTPSGCIELLKRYNIDVTGKKVVVIGKSSIVGLPLSLMLLHLDATVTIVHIKTKNIESETKTADILISACGQAEMINKEWIKKDAVIIDIGINSVKDLTRKRGYKLVGDVDFESVKHSVSYITPVPGGVGPMTIAMLMKHTVESCRRFNTIQS